MIALDPLLLFAAAAVPAPEAGMTTAVATMSLAPTLEALAVFPRRLAAHHATVPEDYAHWTPPSWDGNPGEHFTAHEQVCHVRDIERDGYHVRLCRALEEDAPVLPDLDSYALARERDYAGADARRALAEFAAARAATVALLARLSPAELARPAEFGGAPITVRGLAHALCSHDQQHLASLQWLLARIDAARTCRGAAP